MLDEGAEPRVLWGVEGFDCSRAGDDQEASISIYLRFQPGRSSKYLDNPIEQDRRSIELRFGTMLGFKQFRHASIRGYLTRRTGNNRFVAAVEVQLHAMDFDSTPRRVTANRNENATRRLSKLHPGRPSFGSR
jgi:hypothetical protein